MNLWQRFTSWLGSFFAKPVQAPVQAPVASTAPNVAPSATVIPGTDRKIDNVTAAYLDVSAETSKILDDRVKNAPDPGPGWVAGNVLDSFGVGKRNTYEAQRPFPFEIHAPGPFEFVWADCPGTPPGTASVVVSGPAGIFSGSSFLKLGSVKVPNAKSGETYTATLIASMSGPGDAQINPL